MKNILSGGAMRKPSFFISSTIYDFTDLRSALKYYLEQQGCSVLASEFNDFPKPLDAHSYDACIQALQKANYFILFIGARVGGWYDEASRISITQQEYREAYKLHLEGKLKLISFVRADVWRLREDRKELSKFLETLGLDPGAKDAIKNHPSKCANDAEFIIKFINEVCRIRETKEALGKKAELPTGNWIHIFETFQDVVDVVQTQIFSGIPLEHATLRQLLLNELLELTRLSLVKFGKDDVFSPLKVAEQFHKVHTFDAKCLRQQYQEVDSEEWYTLAYLGVHLIVLKYNTLILPRALESGVFLKYDMASGTFQEEPVYRALYKLNEEIRLFNKANSNDTARLILQTAPINRADREKSINIETVKLFAYLQQIDRWSNIIELACAVIKYLRGETFTMPKLRPDTFIVGLEGESKREGATLDDVNKFIQGKH
ncbi:MAG: DUF4062 domain-containing protein [Deltaproteobacteria bacterium]|nr:DUF4062 domain-containing protein [Deltaproteobacteria bacterium]